jgi:hypothetical protein
MFSDDGIYIVGKAKKRSSEGGILSWLELTRPTITITLKLCQIPYKTATRRAILTSL